MAHNLEAIKGGGGSIRVGTTGTIGALMTRELESIKSEPKGPNSPRTRHQMAPVSISCNAITSKRLHSRKDGASSSGSVDNMNPDVHRKIKGGHMKNNSGIPMLESDDNPTNNIPSRAKADRKVTNIVEVVDIKCGSTEKAWAAGPITNRLKKLGFSKLSEGTT
ncbi:hypothetical protein MLD38_022061 [Melastoma candidum]|uniref:Uncharacterized protein n=1 Tax=Melastoma candidum TaxID=119954 RepID=A0ACB9QL05_9MYRT|nr:hypothetical protein MLD38_022061 [Melastoma candidum]